MLSELEKIENFLELSAPNFFLNEIKISPVQNLWVCDSIKCSLHLLWRQLLLEKDAGKPCPGREPHDWHAGKVAPRSDMGLSVSPPSFLPGQEEWLVQLVSV